MVVYPSGIGSNTWSITVDDANNGNHLDIAVS
jgi:hypothetical protein